MSPVWGQPEDGLSRLSPQIAEQVGEGGFKSIVVFPVREVEDWTSPRFAGA